MSAIFTIGHSTHPWADFVRILARHGIRVVADVRRLPASRRQPHFSRLALERGLADIGIAYRWLPDLGGRREPTGSTTNAAWRDAALRGYADHTATPEFLAARASLEALARSAPTAFLCAERDPLQCHRQILADALAARGWAVHHILGEATPRSHRITPSAVIDAAGVVEYPARAPRSLFDGD